MPDLRNKRILLIDDNTEIHKDFRKILEAKYHNKGMEKTESILFDTPDKPTHKQVIESTYTLDSAYQGQAGIELARKALLAEQPYALAFVDIRMPPGIDGIETVQKIWEIDPEMQIVICTAYSDYNWEDMLIKLHGSDNFLILKKPFDMIEVRQLTASLTMKWELRRRVQYQVENLEKTIKERTAELSHAKELAETANELKNVFLQNISHELRVPLTSIISFSELMSNKKPDEIDYKSYSEDILSSAKDLARMISDLLDVSKLESGTLTMNPVLIDLHQITKEVRNALHGLITNKHIHFEIKIDPKLTHIITDPERLKFIFFHFVANAIKVTPDSGRIEVHVTTTNKKHFRIEVIDTGIGIHKEDLGKLFTILHQIDSSMSKSYPGVGIGLALIRRIVESQGGEVGVESAPGAGSKFFAILPMHPHE